MGRKYYCDYCNKRIPSGLSHRKRHNQGIQHINNKRSYYLQFQDSVEILSNERFKKICNKFIKDASCPFGDDCKYSHRSNYELIQLIGQTKQNSDFKYRTTFDIQRWIKKKLVNKTILPESLAL